MQKSSHCGLEFGVVVAVTAAAACDRRKRTLLPRCFQLFSSLAMRCGKELKRKKEKKTIFRTMNDVLMIEMKENIISRFDDQICKRNKRARERNTDLLNARILAFRSIDNSLCFLFDLPL